MKSQGEFNNVLAVFTCVEQDDEMKQVDEAAEEVCKTLRSIGSCRNVVIVPFVHLSGRIARPEKAIALLRALYSQLKSVGLEVDSVSFGYHKTFELHFRGYGHPLAVAYRSFPRD
jgi:threonyl-tRNA synthetase